MPTEFVVLIPARLASTRLPDKPLADIDGKPMIVRVAEQARRSHASRVVVATDSPRIEAAVRAHGLEAIATAATHPSGTDRLAEAATLLGLPPDTIIVNVQGDEPELPPDLVDAVADALAGDPLAAIATAAHPIDRLEDWFNPNVVKVELDLAGRALTFSRAPIPFHRDGLRGWPTPDPDAARRALAEAAPLRHIGLYAYRAGFLTDYAAMPPADLERIEALEQMRAVVQGHRIRVVVADQAPPAGVDTPEDLAAVRSRLTARGPSRGIA